VSDGDGSSEILDLPQSARLEYHCRLEGGRGRLGLWLDGRKILDEELGEVTFLLPPIGAGQHALGITVFRESLNMTGLSEVHVDGEKRWRIQHDPEEEGFLGNHTLFLNLV
jgi:hypothetical protein